jgi:hypothetical protein
MPMSTIDLQQRLEKLPETYQAYILSDLPRVITDTFNEYHKLDGGKKLALENGFALYLLFFLTLDDFIEFIVAECGINKEEVKVLVSAMHTALPKEIMDIHDQISALAFEAAPALDPVPAPASSIQEDLAEIEKSLHQLSPVRTMASDGKQIGYSSTIEDTHTSTQSALINETKE